MNQVIMLIVAHLILQFIFLIEIKAQSLPYNTPDISSQYSNKNFQPSLAVVIAFLCIMFVMTFFLLIYAKFCHRGSFSHTTTNQIQDGLIRSRSSASGIDKKVIESLPFFRFSSLKGSREGLECAVCLAKFEDIEILRLLPKCKHAFHIDCIDQWLEKHSSCPLCRRKVDLLELPYSNSLRFLWDDLESRQESNLELFVQREENRNGSSRFSSFRKLGKEEELPICDEIERPLHKFNHEIVVSDRVLFRSRWSNVSSSDLMFLNSELINDASSARFSARDARSVQQTMEIRGVDLKSKRSHGFESNNLNREDKRSMSEIIVHPRFTESRNDRHSIVDQSGAKEERMRRLWLPIARKTVQWFVNRETASTKSQGLNQIQNV